LLKNILKQESQSDVGFVSLTEDEIYSSLEIIKKNGYALKNSYFNRSLHVFAAPVLDRDGYPFASVSVVAPSIRISKEEMLKTSHDAVMSTVEKISKSLRVSGSISSVHKINH